MKKLLLILLMIPTLSFAEDFGFGDIDFSKGLFINESGAIQEYEIPSVSCLYYDKFYEEQINYCNQAIHNESKGMDLQTCATTRYEELACTDKNWNTKEKKRSAEEKKRKAEKKRRKQAEKKENDCINESARAMNDFTAKKIYNRCMKRKK